MNSLIAYPSVAKSLQRRVVNKVLSLFLPLPRKFPLPLSLYRGSQWWSVNRRAAEYILKFIKDFPEYMNFQQYTFCSDETFFQTIVLNAKDEEIRNNIINDNLRQIEWAPSKCHPIIYTHQHFDLLTQSGKLFARKFDEAVDSKIFDMLDKRIVENT